MTCPYCGGSIDNQARSCPYCDRALTLQPQSIPMPHLGKYRSGSDYLQLDKTCLTLFHQGTFRSSTRQIGYQDIREVTYQAAQGNTPGKLWIRTKDDEPDMASAPAMHFRQTESALFHELYTRLDAIAQCNMAGVTPVLSFAAAPARPAAAPARPVQQHIRITAACCPRCRCTSIRAAKRGYRFGLGLLGFLLLPVFGLLLGFIGSKKLRCTCLQCGYRWDI